jgi:hypothetical protein
MNVGDRLTDTIVAKVEARGCQSLDRPPAVGYERVDTNRGRSALELRGLCGRSDYPHRRRRDTKEKREPPHLSTSAWAAFRYASKRHACPRM